MQRIRNATVLLAVGLTLAAMGAVAKDETTVEPIATIVTNDSSTPVPTVTVGRIPYQTLDYADTHSLGGSAVCKPVNIPPNMLLTIKAINVEVDVYSSGSVPPYAYLSVSRYSGAGIPIFTTSIGGPMQQWTTTTYSNYKYTGVVNPNLFIGTTQNPNVYYTAEFCLLSPPDNAPNIHASWVITGYLENNETIMDGNSIQ